MKILVTAGTGTVGTALIAQLRQHLVDIRVMTRSEEKAAQMPAGVTPVVGDLLDIDFMREQLADVDAVFLNCPVDLAETYQGLLAVDLAKRAEVQKLVYLSGQDPEGLFTPPHCGVKWVTERAVKTSGITYTILRPNTFMQNDLPLKDFIRQGVYPLPLGEIGVARVDARDIAELAAIALTSSKLDNETLSVAGPEPVTGTSTAALWAEALGRPVQSVGDIDTFEQTLRLMVTPAEARDIWLMYEHFNLNGYPAPAGAIERMTEVLGRSPGDFRRFTQDMAAEWAKEPSGS